MQLFTQALILAVALVSVSAVPNFGGDLSLFRMVMGEAESRVLTPAAQTCANNYLNATQKNGDKLANATNLCEEAANRTTVANRQQSNATVTLIRTQLLNLEKNLELCRNETDSARFLNCTTATFDKNLQLLDTSNSQAYQTQTLFVANTTQVAAARTNCISAAVSEAKVAAIQSANDYDSCVAKTQAQRDIPHEEIRPVQEEVFQQPIQHIQEEPIQEEPIPQQQTVF
ncbi:uncharacterized protein [Drosophila bipectinata]|uniref:uncharacterized protein n=1 Tax=Drosophila bipectinata TaxID=42026 RepID=UPI001C88F34B|nr:uncharacterized protein LOC108123425 [Drosophila bipectinata]